MKFSRTVSAAMSGARSVAVSVATFALGFCALSVPSVGLSLNSAPAGTEYVSPEKAVILAAAEKAKANNKKLLVLVSAAWCGPCAQLDKELKAHPEVIEKLKEKFEVYYVEDVLVLGDRDFVPNVTAYPSFYIFDPTTNQWVSTLAGKIETLVNDIEEVAFNSTAYLSHWTKYKEHLKNGVKFRYPGEEEPVTPETQAQGEFSSAMGSFLTGAAFHMQSAEFVEKIKEVLSDIQSHPNQFEESEAESLKFWITLEAVTVQIVVGKMTLAEAQAEFPSLYVDFEKSWFFDYQGFNSVLESIAYQKGTLAAAQACSALAEDINRRVVIDEDAFPNAKDFGLARKFSRFLKCKRMELQAQLVSRDQAMSDLDIVLNNPEVKSMAPEAYGSIIEVALGLYVVAGDFTKARDLQVLRRAKTMEDLDKEIAENQLKIDEELAKPEGQRDQSVIKTAQASIEEVQLKKERMGHAIDQLLEGWARGVHPQAVSEYEG